MRFKDNKKEYWRLYSQKYRQIHKESVQKYNRIYKEEEQYNEKYNKNIRSRVLEIVSRGKLECVNCHCDFISVLEINHKNGGGYKELKGSGKSTNSYQFYRDIISGKRSIDDLELMCKLCNNLHYIELKYGELPFKVIWSK